MSWYSDRGEWAQLGRIADAEDTGDGMNDPEEYIVGNYRLDELLGQGGSADVYRGTHIYLETQAAIKISRSEWMHDDIAMFLEEARRVAQLRHPHIVRVLDFGVQEQMPFLVMDYAPNGTVRQGYPKGSLLTLRRILDYVEQIADALQYIHDRGLIHRDIKPENLLFGPDYELLLSDFGIAITAHKVSMSEEIPAGTVSYMAPEQIEGHACFATDQYALGIVVYEWLCGRRPFQGTRHEIIGQHLDMDPPSLCECVPDVPPAVEAVVLRALAKDPRQRFKNMQAFAATLRRAIEGEDDFEDRASTQRDGDAPLYQRDQYISQAAQQVILPQRPLRNRSRGNNGGMQMQRRKVWREIAALYALDLLVTTVLGCILYAVGASPFWLGMLLALCMVLLPLIGAFARKRYPLFFLTCGIALAGIVPALLLHDVVLFIVVYIILLLLSLLTALTVGINGV